MKSTKSTPATTPVQTWHCLGRGEHFNADRTLYVSRTRDGWEYGVILDGVRYREGETTRPIGRAKVLAEAADCQMVP